MSKKPRTYRVTRTVASTARDGVRGAGLLAKFFVHNVKHVGVSTKSVARSAKQGLRDGWAQS